MELWLTKQRRYNISFESKSQQDAHRYLGKNQVKSGLPEFSSAKASATASWHIKRTHKVYQATRNSKRWVDRFIAILFGDFIIV